MLLRIPGPHQHLPLEVSISRGGTSKLQQDISGSSQLGAEEIVKKSQFIN